jgi:hypothetical protein
VNEARRVVDRTAEILNSMEGVSAVTFHDNTSHDQSTNLATITNWHNAQTRDYDVSVHFNAYDGSAHGVEVLYVTQQSLAGRLSADIAAAGSFTNRGAKYRSDLYVLNNTEMPAVLLEVCFCDNTSDSNKYNASFEAICTAIAEELGGQKAPGEAPPEPEEPVEPPTEENRVDILGHKEGDVAIYINGTLVTGRERCENAVHLRVRLTGDVTITLNGEEFHNAPVEPPTTEEPPEYPFNQMDIITTVFGGNADPNNSAYSPYEFIDDNVLGVALPWKFAGDRPLVKVTNVENGKSVTCEIVDLGPWLTDDNYFEIGERPLAETCYLNNKPLPRGPNAGIVPNGAGIDLTPGAADAIGISGKGKVHWKFLEGDVA